MKKLAIVLDSFSGLYLDEIQKQENIFFLSLQIEIEDKIIQEGIERPTNELINNIKISNKKISTSLPSPSLIQDLIKKLNNEYENVIFLPIAKHMSGTHDTLLTFSKEHQNMCVINNHFVGDTYMEIAKKALLMSKEGFSFKEIIHFINKMNDNTVGYIVPDELTSLINSGRLKGVKKHIISSGNLTIIIKVGTKLVTSGISRSKNSAIKKVFDKLNNFCLANPYINGYVYKIVYSYGNKNLNIAKKYAKENNISIKSEIKSSLSVLVHTGYGATYIGVSPNIK